MSFWRKEVIDFALDHETKKHIREQLAWIAREPQNPRPYHHLAQLFRMSGQSDKALGLLLEAVRLDPAFAAAHGSLAEMYAIAGDLPAARRHAQRAAALGDRRPLDLLDRYA